MPRWHFIKNVLGLGSNAWLSKKWCMSFSQEVCILRVGWERDLSASFGGVWFAWGPVYAEAQDRPRPALRPAPWCPQPVSVPAWVLGPALRPRQQQQQWSRKDVLRHHRLLEQRAALLWGCLGTFIWTTVLSEQLLDKRLDTKNPSGWIVEAQSGWQDAIWVIFSCNQYWVLAVKRYLLPIIHFPCQRFIQ